MNAVIFIEPHERSDAVGAYEDRLNKDQIDEIFDAPESALVRLDIRDGKTEVMIIEEG
jgi:hypothetical protein